MKIRSKLNSNFERNVINYGSPLFRCIRKRVSFRFSPTTREKSMNESTGCEPVPGLDELAAVTSIAINWSSIKAGHRLSRTLNYASLGHDRESLQNILKSTVSFFLFLFLFVCQSLIDTISFGIYRISTFLSFDVFLLTNKRIN